MARKVSIEETIAQIFSTADLAVAESLLRVAQGIVKGRKPAVKKPAKVVGNTAQFNS